MTKLKPETAELLERLRRLNSLVEELIGVVCELKQQIIEQADDAEPPEEA